MSPCQKALADAQARLADSEGVSRFARECRRLSVTAARERLEQERLGVEMVLGVLRAQLAEYRHQGQAARDMHRLAEASAWAGMASAVEESIRRVQG